MRLPLFMSITTFHRPWASATPHNENNDVVSAKKTVHCGFVKSHEVSEDSKNNYFSRLDNWANAAPTATELDSRKEAIHNIKNLVTHYGYMPSIKHPLNLSNLNLTSLPPLPDGTKQLDISNNQLSRIGNLPSALRQVNIQGNRLSAPPENLHTLSNKCTVKLDAKILWAAYHQREIYRTQEKNRHLGPGLQPVPDNSLPTYDSLPSNATSPPSYVLPPAIPQTPPPCYAPSTAMPHTPPPNYERAISRAAQERVLVNNSDGHRLPSTPIAIPATSSPDMTRSTSTSYQANSHSNMLRQDSVTTSTTPLTPRDAWIRQRRLTSYSSLSNLSVGSDDVFIPRQRAETSV